MFSIGAQTKLDEELEASLSEEDIALRNMIVARFLTPEYDLDTSLIKAEKGEQTVFNVQPRQQGLYKIEFTVRAKEGFESQAQMSMSIFADKNLATSVTLTGADTEWKTFSFDQPAFVGSFFLKFFFGQTGLEVGKVHFTLKVTREELMKRFKEEGNK